MMAGLRLLSEEEVGYVAGSSIIVNGQLPPDPWAGYQPWTQTVSYEWYMANMYQDPHQPPPAASYDYGGTSGSDAEPVNPDNSSYDEAAHASVEGTLAGVEDDIRSGIKANGGADFTIEVLDQKWSAKQLADSLGKLGNVLSLYEAHELTEDLLSGDADLADALGFVAATAGAAAVAAAGGGALGAFVAGVTVGVLVEHGSRALGSALATAYEEAMGWAIHESGIFQNVDPNQLPAQQEVDLWRPLFGPTMNFNDSYSSNTYTPPANSPYGYIDPQLAAYYMSLNPYG